VGDAKSEVGFRPFRPRSSGIALQLLAGVFYSSFQWELR